MSSILGYKNLIDSSVLTTDGTWNPSLANLQIRALANVAVSIDATKIYIDHLAAETARVVWIAAHNFQAADPIRVDRGSTIGGTDAYIGSSITAWPFTPLVGTRDGAVYGIPIVMPANSARYTTITIPVGVQIGRPFVGPAFETAIGPTELTDEFIGPNSTIRRTLNGADWVQSRKEQRGEALTFPALTYAEGALLDEIILTHSITGEVVWIPDTADRAECQRRGFLGTLRKLSPLAYRSWKYKGVAIGLDERGGAP